MLLRPVTEHQLRVGRAGSCPSFRRQMFTERCDHVHIKFRLFWVSATECLWLLLCLPVLSVFSVTPLVFFVSLFFDCLLLQSVSYSICLHCLLISSIYLSILSIHCLVFLVSFICFSIRPSFYLFISNDLFFLYLSYTYLACLCSSVSSVYSSLSISSTNLSPLICLLFVSFVCPLCLYP